MTSNVGSSTICKEKTMGFGATSKNSKDVEEKEYDQLKEKTMKALKDGFRPEFLNRIDEVVIFHSLTKENIKEIVKLETNKLVDRAKELKIDLVIGEDVLEFIGTKGTNLEQGARPVKRAIQKELEDTLSVAILKGIASEGSLVKAFIADDKVCYEKVEVFTE